MASEQISWTYKHFCKSVCIETGLFLLVEPSTGADIALVLDYATTPDNIKRISTFTTSIIDGLDISPSGVHVALITYGTNATIVFPFNALQGPQVNKDEVKALVNTAKQMPGRPRIDKALEVADRELFTTEAGSRPGVPKVKNTWIPSCGCNYFGKSQKIKVARLKVRFSSYRVNLQPLFSPINFLPNSLRS